ncbi:MAG: hypothetical protein OXF97_02060 [Nitrospira sp.]|nr:hypothetical protein [Nitrospira sp.]
MSDEESVKDMAIDGQGKLFEIGVSFRYAQEHGWVMQAITGFLSAYFMEDASFRLKRHLHELETGMYVWTCEAPGEKFMRRLFKRLQVDIPPFELYQRDSPSDGPPRHVIDLPSLHPEEDS